MQTAHHPHDHFFRATFGRAEVVRDFIQYYLPESLREAVDSDTLQPFVGLSVLKHVFDTEAEWRDFLPRLMRLLAALEQARTGLDYIELVLRYLVTAAPKLESDALYRAIDQAFVEDGGTLVSTIAQEWMRQGREQGIEQGIEQGKELGAVEATRENVLELLEVRFDKVPVRVVAQVLHIDDLALLKELHKHAAMDASLAAFEQTLSEVLR